MEVTVSEVRPSPARRLVLLSTPVAFAALTVFHPAEDPQDLGGDVTVWMTVHVIQLVLSVFLAYCLWFLLEPLVGRAATLARAAIPVFLVSFSAFDAVAGLATGWLAGTIDGENAAEAQATNRAIEELFAENWLTGSFSVAGSVSAMAWLTIAVGGAMALHRAGADRLTVALMAASGLFLNHPAPTGTLGMLALFGVAMRQDRLQRRSAGTPRVANAAP